MTIKKIDLSICQDVCSAVSRTHMKHHCVWALHAERMAVHAVAIGQSVLGNGSLREIRQTALIDAHLKPQFVTWRKESIYQTRVNVLASHIKSEGLMLRPSIALTGENDHLQLFSSQGREHVMPSVLTEEETSVTIGLLYHQRRIAQFATIEGYHCGIIQLGPTKFETQRSDVGRNGDMGIVGIDSGDDSANIRCRGHFALLTRCHEYARNGEGNNN